MNMTWGEIKTAWFTMLGAEAEQFTDFEFGQMIDDAQQYIGMILPSRMVPELMVMDQSVSSFSFEALSTGVPFVVAKGDVMQVVSMSWDTEDYSALRPDPKYSPGRKVELEEFMRLKAFSTEQIWCERGDYVYLSPAPGDDGSGGYNVLMTYKQEPDTYHYMTGNDVTAVCAYFHKHSSQEMELFDHDTLSAVTFASLGLDPTDFDGGSLVLFWRGPDDFTDPFTNLVDTCTTYPVVRCGDEGSTRGVIYIDPRYSFESNDNTVGILHKPQTGGEIWTSRGDSTSLSLDGRWQEPMLLRAMELAMIKLGKLDKAQLYRARLNESFKALGVSRMEDEK
jgi:hypothetical protein